MTGMKQILLVVPAMMFCLAGCISTPPAIPPVQAVEAIIRDSVNKPKGKITQKDYERIHRLHLLDKEIGDLKAMPIFQYASNLEDLNLYDNRISDLAPISKLSKLSWLNLGRNQIKDLSPLKSLLHLKKLYIYENPNLTLYEIEKLKKALPNCEIFHNTK